MALEVRPKDIRDVSLKVAKKLETYMNYTKRELRFDPRGGGYGTTSLMLPYEMLYRVTDQALLDKLSPRHIKKMSTLDSKEQRSRRFNSKPIHPEVYYNSRRPITYREADRLVDNANNLFSAQPIEKLQMIHRYRPRSRIEDSVELGKVKNYRLHVGSVLNSQNYIDYYKKQGLQTGNRDQAPRLQNLKQKTKASLPPITGRKLSLTAKQQQQQVPDDGRREMRSPALHYTPERTSTDQHVRWLSIDEQPYGQDTDRSKQSGQSVPATHPNQPLPGHDHPKRTYPPGFEKKPELSSGNSTHEQAPRDSQKTSIAQSSFVNFAMGAESDTIAPQTDDVIGYVDDEFTEDEPSSFPDTMLDEDAISADQHALSEDSNSYRKDGGMVDISGVQEDIDKMESDAFSLRLQTNDGEHAHSYKAGLNLEKRSQPSYIASDETLKWFDAPVTGEDENADKMLKHDGGSEESDKTKHNLSANLEMTARMLDPNLDRVTTELVNRVLADLDEEELLMHEDGIKGDTNDRELDITAHRLVEAILKQIMNEEELEEFN